MLAHCERGVRKITLEMYLKILKVCHYKMKIEDK